MTSEIPPKYYKRIIGFLLIAATTIVYFQVRNHQFVNLDDYMYIKDNSFVRNGLTMDSIKWAFSSFSYASNWHPLTWLSHMLDAQIFGYTNSGAQHLVNLAFHLLNTLLLFLFLLRATGHIWRSALVAALFALHPLHVESVAWVAERKDVLSTFFGLLSLYAFTVYVKTPGRGKRFYIAAVFLAAIGLMAKPMLVTFPFILLLFDIWPFHRLRWQAPSPENVETDHVETDNNGSDDAEIAPSAKTEMESAAEEDVTAPVPEYLDESKYSIGYLIFEKAPFFILTAILCGITLFTQNTTGAVTDRIVWPLGGRIANAICSYIAYLWQTVWPMDLACFYPYNWTIPLSRVLISLVLLAAVSLLSLRFRKTKPFLPIGWFFYLGTLVPVIGLVQVGEQARADRYTYLPLIGVFIMIAWSLPEIKNKFGRNSLIAAVGAILLFYSAVTWKQVGYWADHFKLYQHAIEATTGNYKAHHYLGLAYSADNQTDKAIEHYQAAISILPGYKLAHYDLGLALKTKGRLADAEVSFRNALKLDHHYLKAIRGLAMVLTEQGHLDQALEQYRAALQLFPNSSRILNNIGIIMIKKNQWEEAEKYFIKSIAADPKHIQAYINLANTFRQKNRFDEAILTFQKVLQIDPYHENATMFLQETIADKNKVIAAIKKTRQALEHYPENLAIYLKLGDLNLQLGKTIEAGNYYRQAYERSSKDLLVLKKLAFFHIQLKEYQKAIPYFEQMIAVAPDTPQFYYNIACLYALQEKKGSAVQWLEKAVNRGYDNWEKIKTDNDLENIRSTLAYKNLVREKSPDQ